MRHVITDNDATARTIFHIGDDEIAATRATPKKFVDDLITHVRQRTHNPIAKGRYAGSIPKVTYQEWRKEWMQRHADKWEWRTYLAMKVNSPDFKYLRSERV